MKTSVLRIPEKNHKVIKYLALVKDVQHTVIFEEMFNLYMEVNKIDIPKSIKD